MPATDPLRLRILKALTAALQEITVANSYKTDVGNDVHRGRVIFGESDPLPMLSILEVPIPIEQIEPPADSEFSSGGWELMIQGFVEDDRENPTDPAHFAMADVKRRLVIEKRKAYESRPEDGILGFGNYVTGLKIGAGVVRPPDEISAKAYFWLTIQLDVVEDLSDPYAD